MQSYAPDSVDVDDFFQSPTELLSHENLLLYADECVMAAVGEPGYKEPSTFRQMMKRPEEERNKWLEGVAKENCQLSQTWSMEIHPQT